MVQVRLGLGRATTSGEGERGPANSPRFGPGMGRPTRPRPLPRPRVRAQVVGSGVLVNTPAVRALVTTVGAATVVVVIGLNAGMVAMVRRTGRGGVIIVWKV